jgi:hypothetical protein
MRKKRHAFTFGEGKGLRRAGYTVLVFLFLLLPSCIGRQDLLDQARENPDSDDITIHNDLTVIGAKSTSVSEVMVVFSADVEATSSGNELNYSVPGLAVSSATRDRADHAVVWLTTSIQSEIVYTLTVSRVRNTSNIPMERESTVTFNGYGYGVQVYSAVLSCMTDGAHPPL